jgi:hypothetical protein
MKRTALNAFFERVIISSLPLVMAPGCKQPTGTGPGPGTNQAVKDMATGVGSGGGSGGSGGGGGEQDLAFDAPQDMAGSGPGDMAHANTDMDGCDVFTMQHPVTIVVPFPASVIPDGGWFRAGGAPTLTVSCKGDMGGCVCVDHCPPPYNNCGSHDNPVDMAGMSGPGQYLVTCSITCGISGRRPEGLEAAAVTSGCVTGHYFATQARLEAASVHAFRVMARELTAHGAPATLVAAAKRAASDEIRHARLTRRLALAHGSRPAPVKVAAARTRSLEEIARENVAEGCVRETFAALVASWQARAAADPAVRELMAGIAVDETRHAQLAWDVHAWLKTKLDRTARRRVSEAKQQSVAELATEMSQPVAPELVHALGLPDVDRARAFVTAAQDELWS